MGSDDFVIMAKGSDSSSPDHYYARCFFCGDSNLHLPMVGISLSMWGDHYSFCKNCLDGMTANDFWTEFFTKLDYSYPPKLIDTEKPKNLDTEEAEGDICFQHVVKSRKLSVREKERRKMTNSLRYKIMRRDGFKCKLCGKTSDDEKLVVDHIHPIAKGGKTEDVNLRTLCHTCNSGKGVKLDTDL